tara:strand:+ start:236 stop:439 length:204 start_codon:yes stop_codon:yes gene_type:complete
MTFSSFLGPLKSSIKAQINNTGNKKIKSSTAATGLFLKHLYNPLISRKNIKNITKAIQNSSDITYIS